MAAKGIPYWPASERPRERLLSKGPDALSDAQLLAILLRTGRRDSSAVQVAMELLHHVGGLGGLVKSGVEELCSIEGVGPAKAAQLKAALELGRRSLATPLSTGMRVSSSADLFRHFYPILRDRKQELFKVVLLDAKNAIIKETTISEGSLTLSIVHPREVFASAIRESAAGVIFLHNHPSGDPTPSQEDRRLTDRLVAAGRLLGISVLDHVIIGDGRYVSFADEGWLTRTAAWE
ncbi:MAG: DNA repair protein RadC [Nitrospira sp.]|nr:DNA repair protein RadC [Nitrospira sp.]MCP9440984.1 DNA repair protein RadC [Nitrospira sp.]